MPIDVSKVKWDAVPNPAKVNWDTSPGTTPTKREKAGRILRPVLEFGGMTLGAVPGVGLGPMGAVAGGGLGYGIGKFMADWIEGKRNRQGTAESLKTSVQDVLEGSGMAATGEVLGPALKIAGKPLKDILGKTTGAGTGAIEEAIASGGKPGKDFVRAMRGELGGEEIVQNAKESLQVIKDKRIAEYRTHLQSVSQNIQPIDMKPIKQKLLGLMNQYHVKFTPNGGIDTSSMAMGKAGRKDIEEIIEEVVQWGKQPGQDKPIGLDALRRRLDDFYSDSSQARQFVQSIRTEVNQTISRSVPEYAEMTKGYAEATSLIKDIEAGLMLRKQGMTGRIVADQTLRRMTSAMRESFPLRKEMVEALSGQGGRDITQQVAGHALSELLPRGIAGTAPAILVEAGLVYRFLNPKFYPILAASSPRVVGEFLRMYGKAISEFPGTSKAAGTAIAYGTRE